MAVEVDAARGLDAVHVDGGVSGEDLGLVGAAAVRLLLREPGVEVRLQVDPVAVGDEAPGEPWDDGPGSCGPDGRTGAVDVRGGPGLTQHDHCDDSDSGTHCHDAEGRDDGLGCETASGWHGVGLC